MDYTETNGKEITRNNNEYIQAKMDLLDQISDEISRCVDCDLYKTKQLYVPGQYTKDAFSQPIRLMFIGGMPGIMDNLSGEPFVGKPGEHLNNMFASIGLSRKNIFLFNTIKCMPPKNALPTTDQFLLCVYYLYKQINIIQPHLIVALGKQAMYVLVQPKRSDFVLTPRYKKLDIDMTRNRVYDFTSPSIDGIIGWSTKVIVTYHPDMLRCKNIVPEVTNDFKFIEAYIKILNQKNEVNIP